MPKRGAKQGDAACLDKVIRIWGNQTSQLNIPSDFCGSQGAQAAPVVRTPVENRFVPDGVATKEPRPDGRPFDESSTNAPPWQGTGSITKDPQVTMGRCWTKYPRMIC